MATKQNIRKLAKEVRAYFTHDEFDAALAKKTLRYFKLRPHRLGWYLGYERLTDIHDEWIRYIWLAKEDNVLQAFRGSYKTTAVVVVGTIWFLLFVSDARVLLPRKEYTSATDTLSSITRLYNSPKVKFLYRKLFNVREFRLREERKDTITLPTKTTATKEGSIVACGTKSNITGLHFERVIPDDIITIKDRVSKAERESTKNFIRELGNVVDPGNPINYLGTPWHPEDGFSILPTPVRFPLGTVVVKGLTPEIVAAKKAKTTASLWAANYDLKHIADENRIFTDPVYADWPARAEPVAWLDPAYGGGNTTALTMFAKYNGELHGRGWVWEKDVAELYERIVNLLREYKAGTLYVESNKDEGYSARDLRTLYPIVAEHKETANKHIKIVSYLKQHFHKIKWAHDVQGEYMAQILDYVEGEEPDDAPDSAASLLREMGFDENDITKRYGIYGEV